MIVLTVFYYVGLHYVFIFAFYRFVSDNAFNSYKAVCQHKLIQAMQKSLHGPETARTYPLSLLEWTSNRKKANMVLQVHCFDGESNFYTLTANKLFSIFLKEKYCLLYISQALSIGLAIQRHISPSHLSFFT